MPWRHHVQALQPQDTRFHGIIQDGAADPLGFKGQGRSSRTEDAATSGTPGTGPGIRLPGLVRQTSDALVHDTPNARMRSVVRLTRSQALLTTWSCSAGVCAAM